MPIEQGVVNVKAKKDRSIQPHIAVVILFAILVIALIAQPIGQHRQYTRFMGKLSTDTTRATAKDNLVCAMGEDEFKIDLETAYAIYKKIIYSELSRPIKRSEEIASQGFTLRYGLFGRLTLAPYTKDGTDYMYVDYEGHGINYTYLAPHLRYEDFKAYAENGRQD